jgi:hypothetical protein
MRDGSSLMFMSAKGLFGLSNPCIIRDGSSLMFYECQGVVWAVESMRHP